MGNYVDRINLLGNNADILGTDYYEGVDLTVKFASEIAQYTDPWAWMKARITAKDFSQLHVADYIPFTTSNNLKFNAQIAGINTYKGSGTTEIGDHIDFISKELWPTSFKMNLVNTNNGTDDAHMPWKASNGYLFVNSLAGEVPNGTTKPYEMASVDYTADGMYFYLPDTLKAAITNKFMYAQTRNNSTSIVSSDNSIEWVDLGKLWLPDEFEVMGAKLVTTTGWTAGGSVQYPIFAYNMNRVKRLSGSTSRHNWWWSSAYTGNTTRFVIVCSLGYVSDSYASNATRAPFCFRISA